MVNFRQNIQELEGYVPGEQPAPGANIVKLNTNENPYPPSPQVIQVLHECEGEWLRRYPDPTAGMLREAAAQVYGVPADWILAANGSDETLALLARAFLEPGRKMAYPIPTYSLYRNLAEMQEAAVVEVPYDEHYQLPVAQLLRVQAELTFVCSPNNPSGTVAPVAELGRLAAGLQGVLAIDEAYTDFAEENALALVRSHENVIILRTLSKGYSLAGLRVGLGVAQPPLLAGLRKIKDSYNVDAIAMRLGTAALRDQAWMQANTARVKGARVDLQQALERLDFLVWPSQANFLWARPHDGDAGRLYEQLKKRGILVRYWDKPGLADKIRITIGTAEQNQTLVTALQELLR